MASGYKTKSKKRVAILVTIVTLLVLFLFVFPTGSGRLTDGGTSYYTPMVFHWYMIYDYSTRWPSVPVYQHDGEEHEKPTTKTVSGGITVYLFDQKIYDNSYTAEVPIDS